MLNASVFETVPQAVDAINQAPRYLGLGVAPLVTGLAPDVIVVVGEITRAWSRVGPIINEVVNSRSFTHAPTLRRPHRPGGRSEIARDHPARAAKTLRSPVGRLTLSIYPLLL
jgi:predicted NBD/HSP70 family sugar kinase